MQKFGVGRPLQCLLLIVVLLVPWAIMVGEMPAILASSEKAIEEDMPIKVIEVEKIVYRNVTVEVEKVKIVYVNDNNADFPQESAANPNEPEHKSIISNNSKPIIYNGDLRARRPQKRTIIAVEVAKTRKSPREFLTMIFASWSFVRTQWNILSRVRVDMWVACEVGVCEYLPIDCVEFEDILYIEDAQGPICIFHRLAQDYADKWRRLNYMFMTSLEFGMMEPFKFILPLYDYVLRADVDCFITPKINNWIPEQPSAIGWGYLGSGWTSGRLRKMAEKYNLTHRGVHHFQSTWYVQADKFVELITLTVDIVQKLLENEFTREICMTLQKENHGKKRCAWPDWHRGVASLYASELALNHIFEDLNAQWKTRLLDVPVTHKTGLVEEIVCAHNIHVGIKNGLWHKFPFHAFFKGGWSTICHQRVKDEYSPEKGISTSGSLNDYCREVAWRSVHAACGFQNLNFNRRPERRRMKELFEPTESILSATDGLS